MTASASVVEFKDSETNNFTVSNSINETSYVTSNQEKEEITSKSNTEIDKPLIENKFEKNIKGESISSSEAENKVTQNYEDPRTTAYNKLLDIKESIINGTERSRAETIEDYKEIKLWYKNILDIYPEIQELLKEIKKLL